ncbi:MAG: metalloregulator ArsR/SmtB family transcription factor [Hyphomonadaceae bacterium]
MKIKPAQAAERAEQASQLLKALANPHRLRIACQLAEAEETVGALAALLGLRETAVSQHLAVMRRERLVAAHRNGQSVRYALTSGAVREVIEALARGLCLEDAQFERR